MQRKKTYKPEQRTAVFSFFAGAGFLDLGFETSGHDVVFVNEIHEPFLNAYRHSRKKMRIPEPRYGYYAGDMEDLTRGAGYQKLKHMVAKAREEKRVVGFIGGPPCPDFSIAGKNRGRDGKHGKLTETYTKLIRQQKPDFFLFENVKGLWETKTHRKFYDELKALLIANKYAVTERLTNAMEYGVAQDRDRIILVGFRTSLFPKKTAEKCVESFPWSAGKAFKREKVMSIKKHKDTISVPQRLTVSHWFKKNEVNTHPNSKHHFKPHVLKKIESILEGDVSGKSFKRLHRNRYSPTAAYGNNEVHLHPVKQRRISAAEALAIQSLPRSFSFPSDMTLSDMFKAIGNGVPYVAARAMGRSINRFLDQRQ